MNIATSNPATAAPSTTTGASSARPADPVADGPGDGQPESPAFGVVLSGHLDDDARTNAADTANGRSVRLAAGTGRIKPADSATDLATGTANNGSTDAAPAGLEGLFRSTGIGGTARSVDVAADPGVSERGDATGDIGDAAANGLAAQLALASQWAALAAPKVATAASTAQADRASGAGMAGDRFAIQSRVDTIRAAARAQGTPGAPSAVDAGADAARLQAGLAAAINANTSADRGARDANVSASRASAAAGTDASALVKGDDGTRADLGPAALERLALLASGSPMAGDGAAAAGQSAAQLGTQFATQLAAQAANAQAVAAPPPGPSSTDALREPVGSPAWSHEVGQATLRMASNDLQNVSLRLNPEHLGPLDVQMRIDNGVAHLQFAATHADTRQALESSRTTLDQMFSDQGMKLGDWSVGHSSSDSAFARDAAPSSQDREGSRPPAVDGIADETVTTTVTTRPTRALGLVDTFA